MASDEEHGSSLGEQLAVVVRRVWEASSGSSQIPVGFTLGVTSCTRGEGVTTIARLLAEASLRLPVSRVLLVEVDDDAPALPAALFEKCVRPTMVARLERLTVGSSGGAAPLRAGLDSMRSRFDLAVAALPPAGRSDNARELAGIFDGVILIIDVQRTPLRVIEQVKNHLDQRGARLVGVILNKA